MSSGVKLSFDANEWTVERAEYEHALLMRVRNHDADPAAASEAAAELLRWYARFGRMKSPEVQQVVQEGIESVMRKVASAALEIRPGARADVTPLDFFPFQRRAVKGGGPKKAGVKQRLLELRAAHGDYLTEEDARAVLTTSAGRSLPQEKWPATVGQIENALTDHLSAVYSDVPPEQRRAFVRESFPYIAWGNPKQVVVYPVHW